MGSNEANAAIAACLVYCVILGCDLWKSGKEISTFRSLGMWVVTLLTGEERGAESLISLGHLEE